MSVDHLPDNRPLTAAGRILRLKNGLYARIEAIQAEMFRVRFSLDGTWTESGLNRYGILRRDLPEPALQVTEQDGKVRFETNAVTLEMQLQDGVLSLQRDGEERIQMDAPEISAGYRLAFLLEDGERIYGLGDVSRENIMRRGEAYELWIRNVKSYIPIPVALSSQGWGVLVNSTWRSFADVGKAIPDRMVFSAPRSDTDFYLFAGDSLPALLQTYTALTGRPKLLPIWGYAFTYVCNENVDAFRMMDEARTFRKEEVPCDLLGLEPGWMERNYDGTTSKSWNKARFPIPPWAPKGPATFFGALERKHFKLSLWLCCNYDLSRYEEECLRGELPPLEGSPMLEEGNDDDFEKDQHLNGQTAETPQDDAPKDDSLGGKAPWFEHLKKFVDQGASAFKLDGAFQVIEHPGRAWANGMDDEQMHNLYTMLYAKQMANGFEEHTGRRAMVYSADGFAGVQQFVASWAGDTGGGPKPLASMLNLAFSGHSNHSCDMDVFQAAGIHFGFLQTWAQLNNWAYWRQPWYLEDADYQMFRDYAHLRYRLLPYLYSMAWQASQTGMPVMRPMPLAYPEHPGWDSVKDEYMLGDSLLVTAFAEKLKLPEGRWLDCWTGEELVGPGCRKADYPENRGGCLLLREGAILPLWPVQQYVTSGTHQELELEIFPGLEETSFTLYEDDGTSLAYRNGEFATTKITFTPTAKGGCVKVDACQGTFPGMPPVRNITFTILGTERKMTITAPTDKLCSFAW